MCNLKTDRAAINTPPPHYAKLHSKVLDRIFKFLVANFPAQTRPSQLLPQPFPEAIPEKMAKFKVLWSLLIIPWVMSRLANFYRVVEAEAVAEAAAEVVAVVAAASERTVKTDTAPRLTKNTRRWSTTTMSCSG